MIYLFCSASRPLYKRDALESTCYPPGHLFRFRYERKYVDTAIWERPRTFERREGVIVFLDTIGREGNKHFDFFPIRTIGTIRLFREGLAIYVDFKFGDFINYGPEDDDTRRAQWCRFFKNLPNRPWPPPQKSGRREEEREGYFIMSNCENNPEFPTESAIAHESWENLVRRLNKTNDLEDSTFFQVLGFYETKRIWSIPIVKLTVPMPLIGSLSEVPIVSKDNSYDSIYPVPMGKSVVLKLLFSRPAYDSNVPGSRRTLEVKAGTESFAGASKSIVYSESRYNEERIVLVCKRVFDSFLSAVSIEQQNEPSGVQGPQPFLLKLLNRWKTGGSPPPDVQAPKPFLLTRIKVPGFIVGVVILGVGVSTLLVGLDADSIELIGSWILPSHAELFECKARVLSAIGKALAPIPIAISAYFAFRRLPLK